MPELWLDAPASVISPGFNYLSVLSTGGAVLNGRGEGIVVETFYLTDEVGNALTDEVGNELTWT